MRTRCLRICIAITSSLSRISQQTRLTSTLSIVPLPRNRFRGLVTNIIWLVSCSALDGLIGARLWSTYPGLLRRGAQTSTDDQEITEAGEHQFPHLSYLFSSRAFNFPIGRTPRQMKFPRNEVFSRDAIRYGRSNVLMSFLFLSFFVFLSLFSSLSSVCGYSSFRMTWRMTNTGRVVGRTTWQRNDRETRAAWRRTR